MEQLVDEALGERLDRFPLTGVETVQTATEARQLVAAKELGALAQRRDSGRHRSSALPVEKASDLVGDDGPNPRDLLATAVAARFGERPEIV